MDAKEWALHRRKRRDGSAFGSYSQDDAMTEFIISGLIAAMVLGSIIVYSWKKHESMSVLLKRNGEKSFVYFMLDSDSDQIKIGRSVDPEKRLEQFKTAEPDIMMLAYYPETKAFNETTLHQRFKRYRMKREWFRATKEIRRIAESGRI